MRKAKYFICLAAVFSLLFAGTGYGASRTEEEVYYEDGSYYIGELTDGIREGWGEMHYSSGTVYQGYWENDKPDGWGICDYSGGARYEGEFVRGECDGYGVYRASNGIVYRGMFYEGKRHGYGAFWYEDGSVWLVESSEGEVSGLGIHVENGEILNYGQYEGSTLTVSGSKESWTNDAGNTYYGYQKEGNLLSGEGITIYQSGTVYLGNYEKNHPSRMGIILWNTGEAYVGEFSGGELSGYGLYYYGDQSRFNYFLGDRTDDGNERNGILMYADASWEKGIFRDGSLISDEGPFSRETGEDGLSGSAENGSDTALQDETGSDASLEDENGSDTSLGDETGSSVFRQEETGSGAVRQENGGKETIAEKISKGVVRIAATSDDSPSYSIGSGFGVGTAWADTDIFVTNQHVVTDEYGNLQEHVYLMLDDADINDRRTLVECRVLDVSDEFPDYAILQAIEPIRGFKALPLRSAGKAAVASDVWAYGYPGLLDDDGTTKAGIRDITVTRGIISRFMEMDTADGTRCIVHDAHINHGNSGGPLVMEDGAVIGMNTYGLGTAIVGLDQEGNTEPNIVSEYSLAIEIDYVMEALDRLGIAYDTM